MRKLLLAIGVLLLAHVALLFVRPSGAFEAPEGDALDVGIVFDVGGRGDKSFNDGAYLGAERAERELGARVRFIEPGEGSDREAGLRLLAAEGVQPSSKGARLTIDGGKVTVLDGPFAEAKELIAGFAILDVKSKEEAIEHATRFAKVVGATKVDVRLVAEF